MTTGIHALTEKEKETLRLLVSGYDAKSMASHLGLSVHTINERLREARRKMAVSSSREAARQLRAAEGPGAPKILADAFLGDASRGDAAPGRASPVAAPRMVRGRGWVIGGFAMSAITALIALASLSGTADAPDAAPATAAATPTSGSAAAIAARRFLELVDEGDWAASWDATGRAFHSSNTIQGWTDASKQVRPPLGALVSRTLIGDEWVPAPPSGYRIVKFRTDFANKAGAIETLSLSLEDGGWKVAGITID